jgi:group I intron endonuclease
MKQIGIYLIKNIKNNRIYVGSSVDIKSRIKQHFSSLIRKDHHNSELQKDFVKYGIENFNYEILELCNKSELLVKELKWFNETKCTNNDIGYNLCVDPTKNIYHGSVLDKLKELNFTKPKRKNITSIYRGVHRSGDSWVAHISLDRINVRIGEFATEELAAQAYDFYAIKIHGKNAKLNFQNFNYDCYEPALKKNFRTIPIIARNSFEEIAFDSKTEASYYFETHVSYIDKCILNNETVNGYNINYKFKSNEELKEYRLNQLQEYCKENHERIMINFGLNYDPYGNHLDNEFMEIVSMRG